MSEERRVSRRKYVAYAGAGVVIVAAAAAGGYYAARRPAPPTPAPTTPVQTVTQIKTVTSPLTEARITTLTIWDQMGYTGMSAGGKAMDIFVDQFSKENPNIRIKRSYFEPVSMREIIDVAIAAGGEPDLFYTWPAAAVLNRYAKAGALYDMTEDAKRLGWYDVIPDMLIKRNSYKGHLYGYPHERDYCGFFYNKDIFDKLDVTVPRTWDELLSICDKAKGAGYIPIVFANKPMWPATNFLSEFFAAVAGMKREEELFFGDAKWTDSDFVEAATLFIDLVKRGYIQKGFSAMDVGEQLALFFDGKAAISGGGGAGTWMLESYASEHGKKFQFGYFYMPEIKKEIGVSTMTGEGSQWEISARSPPEVQKTAIDFIDFIMKEDKVGIWMEQGWMVPIRRKIDWDYVTKNYKIHPLLLECYMNAEKVNEVGYDLHTTTPEDVTDVLYRSLQSMLALEIKPEEAMSRIQEQWERAKAEGRTWTP
jgi:raffinose/stachyose/melibiose transport system substrate-binding protein